MALARGPRSRLSALRRHIGACGVRGGGEVAAAPSPVLQPGRTVRDGDRIRVAVVATTKMAGADAGLFEGDTTSFTCGKCQGLLQPALDNICRGMAQHETRELAVGPGDSSHPAPTRDEALVVRLPMGRTGQTVRAGQTVRVAYRGSQQLATVLAWDPEAGAATCDLNDPLAGEALQVRVTLQGFDVDTTTERWKALFPEPRTVPERRFAVEELAAYDGRLRPDVLLSVRGYVYDVSSGAAFYGPGGPYGHMAGKDATVALAKFSLDARWLNTPWSGLDEDEEERLAGFIRTFQEKYPCVGRLIEPA